jgi:hypothetical protein
MTDRNKLKDRARDELFSHINRCGVLEAAHGDQEHWLQETMEYLGDRYPDLDDADLRDLYRVGMAFCRPAIANGKKAAAAMNADAASTLAAGVEEPTAA